MTNEERVNKFKNEKIAINCETVEQAKAFIEWCYANGLVWYDGNEYKTHFEYYKEKTCYTYNFSNDNILEYCDPIYYKEHDYQIIKYKDFMKEEKKMTNLEWLLKDQSMDISVVDRNEYGQIIINVEKNKLYKFMNECRNKIPCDIILWFLQKYKEPIKLTKMEQDLLKCYSVGKTGHAFNGIDCLRELKCEGYFENVDETMKIKDILNNCEIIE